jgi:hypothetical protein
MNQQGSVEVVDGNGWHKEFSLEKSLIYIGSAAGNDIVLDSSRGSGVAPRHLQLIVLSGDELRYRAVNLGPADIVLDQEAGRVLSPRSAAEIGHGQRLRLGDFGLVFNLSGVAAAAASSIAVKTQSAPEGQVAVPPSSLAAAGTAAVIDSIVVSEDIGLELALPSATLQPGHPLEGVITVRNMGKEPGVQFKLELEGLDPEFYEMGPGPILFPNVEKGVFLRLDHPRRPSPRAGRHEFSIRASAPQAYPGEHAVVTQEIEIAPYYSHKLNLVPVD